MSPSTAKDAEVARYLAVILVGGLAAEQVAAEFGAGLAPDRSGAELNHALLAQALAAAQLSRSFDRYEQQARPMLRANWQKVETLAQVLLRDGACPSETAVQIFHP